MASVLIESAKILAGDELTEANILVDEGKIKSISRTTPTFAPAKKINAKGLIALPGMIDAHVHLRDLELSYKETFETGTQAAAVGGFTTVFDMPNTRPPTSSAAALARKIAAAEGHIYSNVAFQGALIPDTDELRRMVEGGAIAFKVYLNKSLEVFDSSNESLLTKALQAAKDNNALVTVHAEDGDMIRRIQEEKVSTGKTSVRDFLDAHPAQAEQVAIRRILGLSRQVGTRIHICHITLPSSVNLARSSGLATCEATAQHLLLNRLAFRKFGTLAICVPPIRPEPERRGLWSLFAKGQVDLLASDHAPHTLEEKNQPNAFQAASGIPGLETSLPLMFTQVSRGRLSLRRLVEATASLPARIFHLANKGALSEGFDADIVLVDPRAKLRIDPNKFLSKAKYSPFKGMRCTGKAVYTLVNGEVVAERDGITGPPAGTIVKSS